jgi:hypothetical protein
MATDYGSFSWPPSGSGGGVSIYPTLADFPATAAQGTLAVAADTGILYEFNGVTWVAIGGPSTVLALGPFGSTPNADGGSISANTLTLQPASATEPGGVSTTTQSFAGQKTFSTGLTGTLTGSASLNVLTSALGNLTDTGTDGISVTGGTGAVVGNVSIAQLAASASQNGYLTSANFTTFNSKQSALTFSDSIVNTSGTVTLVNDNATPGDSMYYGTNSGGTKGYYAQPGGTVTSVGLTVPTFLSVTPSSISTTGTFNISLSGTALPVLGGGTGDTSFVANQVVIGGATTTGALAQVAGGSAGQVLTAVSSTAAPTWQALPAAPTLTSLGIFAGNTACSSGAVSQAVTFSTAYGSTSYSVHATMLNVTDATPMFIPVTITAQSTTGFSASWNAPLPTANYLLSWSSTTNN